MKIGIVGASGDLGQQLLVQAISQRLSVVAHDTIPRPLEPTVTGIDPSVKQRIGLAEASWVKSLAELVQQTDVIHWTAPIEALSELVQFDSGKLLVLHASVVGDSLAAAYNLKIKPGFGGEVALAHLLMNSHRTVIVASDYGASDKLSEHMISLGLNPIAKTAKEADAIMAISQAPMAILHTILAEELEQLAQAGLLTPSGEDFKTALTKRASNWTPTTLKTILGNPELPGVIERMRKILSNAQD